MKRKRFNNFIKAFTNVRTVLTDEQAANHSDLFPEWNGNFFSFEIGQRVQYNGTLYKVLQNHTSQSDWTPDQAPSLFAEILPGQEGTNIGEWVQPNSTNPYMQGDKVMHNNKTWESSIDNNVWEPGVYGWIEVFV